MECFSVMKRNKVELYKATWINQTNVCESKKPNVKEISLPDSKQIKLKNRNKLIFDLEARIMAVGS